MINRIKSDLYLLRHKKLFWLLTALAVINSVIFCLIMFTGDFEASGQALRYEYISPDLTHISSIKLGLEMMNFDGAGITISLPDNYYGHITQRIFDGKLSFYDLSLVNFMNILGYAFYGIYTAAVLISSEISHGSFKNPLSKGIKRSEIFAGKYFSVFITMIFFCVIHSAITALCFAVKNGGISAQGEELFGIITIKILSILYLAAFAALITFIAFISDNSGIMAAISSGIFLIFHTALDLLAGYSKNFSQIASFWITIRPQELFIRTVIFDPLLIFSDVLVCVAYIALFYRLGYVVFNKRDF